ncbi:MAG: YfhO family protein [Lachnospiraceae bacterium]|nr:YfhO family protein [Lachnospiraceae bacterium]
MIGRWKRKAEDGSRSLVRSYTIAFAVMCLLVFVWYYAVGRTLMWKGDSWTQHYKALMYYARYLRSIVRSAFSERSFTIPAFDFTIGEGSDVLETMHYYVIGDPFAFPAVFVPSVAMVFYYVAMILLRMYLAGLAFIWMCRFVSKGSYNNSVSLIAGAIVYVFGYWGLFNAARHPYFLNPMIYLPLLVIGVEKILRRERPYLFVGTVAIAGLSNFYFFYLLAIMTALFAVARVLYLHRLEGSSILRNGARLMAGALLGLALSAIVFLPMCRAFLTNARMGTDNARHLLYPLSYYQKLPALAFSSGDAYWVCMGIAAPVFFAICLLWRRKGNLFVKFCMAACGVMLTFPIFGQIFNGFSYMTNRWSFVIALTCGIALVAAWDDLCNVTIREWKFLVICTAVYSVICLISWNSRTYRSFGTIAILVLLLVLIRPKEGEDAVDAAGKRATAVLSLIALAIFLNSFWLNAYVSDSYASKSAYVWDAWRVPERNEALLVKNAAAGLGDYGFIRYSGTELEKNANLIGRASSTQFYWTIGSPSTAEYRTALSLREYSLYKYNGYDERAGLTTLASVSYYLENPENTAKAPYGFRRVGMLSDGKTKLYKNEYALSLMYTYGSFMPRSEWDALPSTRKEEVLLAAMVTEDDEEVSGIPTFAIPELTWKAKEIPAAVQCGEGVRYEDGHFVVDAKNAAATLVFEGLQDAETYLDLTGCRIELTSGHEQEVSGMKPFKKPIDIGPFTFEKPADFRFLGTARIDWKVPDTARLMISGSNGTNKELELHNNEYCYYNGRDAFCVNLGYAQEAQTSVRIEFGETGTYSFDSLKVWCRPMEGYAETVAARAEDPVRDLKVGTNELSATVVTERPKLVCFAIPYHTGFKVYVNGKEAKLLHANVGYMGVAVESGENRILLRYNAPLRLAGGLISFAALVAAILFVVYNERKIRRDSGIVKH